MNVRRAPAPPYVAGLLLLGGILILGIVQWSFLPLLIQNAPGATHAVLEFSGNHTSKFAAPFKAFHGTGPAPCVVQAKLILPAAAVPRVRVPETPITGPLESFLTHSLLRAPPSL